MTLHCRVDEEPEIDPANPYEVAAFIEAAEHAHCRGLCEQCGLDHPKPCPNVAAA